MNNPAQDMSKIPDGNQIIFYGAGKVGKECLDAYNKNKSFTLLNFVDKKHDEINSLEGTPVKSPQTLLSDDFDYVFITSKTYHAEIKDDLKILGVSEAKILNP